MSECYSKLCLDCGNERWGRRSSICKLCSDNRKKKLGIYRAEGLRSFESPQERAYFERYKVSWPDLPK